MFTAKWSAYWRLMRFDKPIGTALLWYPAAWALWIASAGWPPTQYLIIFFAGTILMRAAGCVINDIADRNLDAHVARTKARPLAAGDLSLQQALACFSLLISMAVLLLLLLPKACFLIALIAVLLTGIYPFTKRWFDMPQLILSLAFTSSIPMAFAALGQPWSADVGLLMLINISWVIAYDTAYAMVDRQDDVLMGVRSTAIMFGRFDKAIVACLQLCAHMLWIPVILSKTNTLLFWPFWIAGGGIFLYQQHLIRKDESTLFFKAFLNNHWYGLVMWLGLVALYTRGLSKCTFSTFSFSL